MLQHRLDQRVGAGAFEGAHAGQQLIQHHAQRIDIAAGVGHSAVQLLGRAVVQRVQVVGAVGHAHRVGRGGGEPACLRCRPDQREIQQFGPAPVAHEDVGGLNLAVQHAVLVGVGQRVGQPANQFDGAGRVGAPTLGQQLAQIAAGRALHRQEDALDRDAGVEHADDATVVQAGDRACLAKQRGVLRSALHIAQAGVARVHQLEHHLAREHRIPRGVEPAAAAFAQAFAQAIAADMAVVGQLARWRGVQHQIQADVHARVQRDSGAVDVAEEQVVVAKVDLCPVVLQPRASIRPRVNGGGVIGTCAGRGRHSRLGMWWHGLWVHSPRTLGVVWLCWPVKNWQEWHGEARARRRGWAGVEYCTNLTD